MTDPILDSIELTNKTCGFCLKYIQGRATCYTPSIKRSSYSLCNQVSEFEFNPGKPSDELNNQPVLTLGKRENGGLETWDPSFTL